MNQKYIEEIKVRAEKATPGPWSVDTNEPFSRQINGVFADKQEQYVFYHDPDGENTVSKKDAEFIANSREDIPALIEAYEQIGMAWDDSKRYAKRLEARNTAKDLQIATLKKALELSIETHSVDPRTIGRLVRYYTQQAQEQERDES
nr:hypothetical protein [uncultured Caproiciproducens sp.]